MIDIKFVSQLQRIDESFEKKFHVSIAMDGIIEDDQVIKMVSSDHTHNRYHDFNFIGNNTNLCRFFFFILFCFA